MVLSSDLRSRTRVEQKSLPLPCYEGHAEVCPEFIKTRHEFPGGCCEFLAADWPAVRSACGYWKTLAGSKVTPNMGSLTGPGCREAFLPLDPSNSVQTPVNYSQWETHVKNPISPAVSHGRSTSLSSVLFIGATFDRGHSFYSEYRVWGLWLAESLCDDLLRRL